MAIRKFLSNGYSPELLAHYLQIKKGDLYLDLDREIPFHCLEDLSLAKQKIDLGVPFEYVTNQVLFWNLPLYVNSHVLIPRVETEILVEHVIRRRSKDQLILWDLCTGSGCIGIALKKAIPELQVTLSDISEEALDVARINAEQNNLDVSFCRGDLLKPFQGQKADIIVCNPPYISETEYENLDLSVKNFEPKQALVGGITGLEFYEKLERELPLFLNPGAKVFFEIGYTQKEALIRLFSSPEWTGQTVLNDWSAKARFFLLEKQ
jgi:release factor glutamine methyltransferase